MPMLFSLTLEAAITAGYCSCGSAARPAALRRALTRGRSIGTLTWPRHPLSRAVVSILPAECTVRRIGVPIEIKSCRGVLRRVQRQSVGQRVNFPRCRFSCSLRLVAFACLPGCKVIRVWNRITYDFPSK
jgi:hypothetical protein